MRVAFVRVLMVPAACLIWLAGCETSTKLGSLVKPTDGQQQAADTTGSINPPLPPPDGAVVPPPPPGAPGEPVHVPKLPGEPMSASASELLGAGASDDLTVAKKYFYQGSYGLAEKYFRRSVELHPKDGEAWVGLAASYDRLRRFDLAERAYRQALGLIGPTPELLNNHGFSYLLRGDYGRARETLLKAQSLDPANPYIRNNLALLEKAMTRAKGVE